MSATVGIDLNALFQAMSDLVAAVRAHNIPGILAAAAKVLAILSGATVPPTTPTMTLSPACLALASPESLTPADLADKVEALAADIKDGTVQLGSNIINIIIAVIKAILGIIIKP